jgi:2-methylisocitrate lyase-like PEP mutase family enzyme
MADADREDKMNATNTTERFAALHQGGEILVLPNAWDAASAAIMADAGAKAVATSSAAVAWAHGYPDGDAVPTTTVLAAIAEVVRVVDVPVTADVEGGYTDDLADLADFITRLVATGVAGINIEDGRRAPALQARKIETARKAADAAGVALFINARTDVYLAALAEGEAALDETLRRAALYRSAGASGIFVPGPKDEALIGRLAAGVDLPLNLMLLPGLPGASRLQALGVRRLSSATAPFRAAYATLAKAVAGWLQDGEASAFAAGAEGLGNLNARFSG